MWSRGYMTRNGVYMEYKVKITGGNLKQGEYMVRNMSANAIIEALRDGFSVSLVAERGIDDILSEIITGNAVGLKTYIRAVTEIKKANASLTDEQAENRVQDYMLKHNVGLELTFEDVLLGIAGGKNETKN